MSPRWRSVLFVPADRPDLAAKAAASGADAVVLDLEDAVPVTRKAAAREELRAGVSSIDGAATTLVRVNPPNGSHFVADITALPEHGVDALIVPKLESPDDLARVTAATELPVVAGIETVLGVLDARAVLVAPVVACYFGAEDYVADLGGARGADNAEVATARSLVAMAARVAGIPALDIVTIDFARSGTPASSASTRARCRSPTTRSCRRRTRSTGRSACSPPSTTRATRRSRSRVRWSTRSWRRAPAPSSTRRAARDDPLVATA
jgi:citrate lyase beta subunit